MKSAVDSWLEALPQRHLAALTRSELTRALRALSSCYVERRAKLVEGAPLGTAGKRAAFALYYGPLHFFTIAAIIRALGLHERPLDTIVDLGCGTGVGGAAWATACASAPPIAAVDRNAWAIAEATWTFERLGLRGRARKGDLFHEIPRTDSANQAIIFAYALNELAEDERRRLLVRLECRARAGAPMLIVESIALRAKPWWPAWAARLTASGAREAE